MRNTKLYPELIVVFIKHAPPLTGLALVALIFIREILPALRRGLDKLFVAVAVTAKQIPFCRRRDARFFLFFTGFAWLL